MDRFEVEVLRILEQRRRAVVAVVQEVRAHEADEGEADTRDRTSFVERSEVSQKVFDRERAELREIEAAITRIRDGHYGECVTCGRAIGHQRLKAVPEARQCLACAGGASVA